MRKDGLAVNGRKSSNSVTPGIVLTLGRRSISPPWTRPAPFIITYSLKDEFGVNEPTPVSTPRTCAPGPGTLNIEYYADPASGETMVSGSKLYLQSLDSSAQSPIAWAGPFTRETGLAAIATVSGKDVSASYYDFQFLETQPVPNGWVWDIGAAFGYGDMFNGECEIAITSGLDAELAVVCNEYGCSVVSGGKLLWIDTDLANSSRTASVVWLFLGSYGDASGEVNFSNLRVAQLGAPWNSANGLLVCSANSVTNPDPIFGMADGSTLTCGRDFLGQTKIFKYGTRGSFTFSFRVVDELNKWVYTATDTTSTLEKLIDGVATIVTTSNGLPSASVCVFRAVGDQISINKDGALGISYTDTEHLFPSGVNFVLDSSSHLALQKGVSEMRVYKTDQSLGSA